MNAHGQTVRLFLVDGTSTGLITAEIINWTGHVLAVPRSKLPEALLRDEPKKTGVYLLVGPDPGSAGKDRVYIGEGDNVAERLKAHAKDATKEFWTKALIITSKDTNLTKAHVRYLEHRLVSLAKEADRADVANGNDPALKLLPESDVADMEFFLSQVKLVLPVLGVDLFRQKPSIRPTSRGSAVSEEELLLVLESKKNEVRATAIERDGEITILSGSTATSKDDFVSNTYDALRRSLIEDGVLKRESEAGPYTFVRDATFASPSAAAAVVLNRNSNGRTEWKIEANGLTLKDWQDQQLDKLEIISRD